MWLESQEPQAHALPAVLAAAVQGTAVMEGKDESTQELKNYERAWLYQRVVCDDGREGYVTSISRRREPRETPTGRPAVGAHLVTRVRVAIDTGPLVGLEARQAPQDITSVPQSPQIVDIMPAPCDII